MTPERLAEIEQLLPTGHCYECGADEYVYELIDALREAQTENDKVKIEAGRAYLSNAKVNESLRALQSAVALMRSLSINPTIPHGMRSLMKAELDRLDTDT